MTEHVGDPLRSRDETARRLHVSLSTVDRLIGEGEIKSIRVRRRRFILESEITAFLATQIAGTEENDL